MLYLIFKFNDTFIYSWHAIGISENMKDESVLVKVFGETPMVKSIDFFLNEGLFFDYSLTEIAEHSGVSWRTLHIVMPKLLKLGFVKETREIGRAKLFMLNKESPIVKRMLELEFNMASDLADSTIEGSKRVSVPSR